MRTTTDLPCALGTAVDQLLDECSRIRRRMAITVGAWLAVGLASGVLAVALAGPAW